MEEKKSKKGGRPRLELNNLKLQRISFALTTDEKNILEEQSRRAGFKMLGHYLYEIVVKKKRNFTVVNSFEMDENEKKQLSGIAKNFNQLTKKVHSMKMVFFTEEDRSLLNSIYLELRELKPKVKK